MSFKSNFLVPDYYPGFVCKCGQCRHTCCQGWDITLNVNEYYRLIGMGCSPELRRKLDCAFCVVDEPAPERYAMVKRNWEGQCPLLSTDGLCSLQLECGEDAISSVCRYYPRSPRTLYDLECACSCSCEGVIEELYGNTEKLGFVHSELEFKLELPEPKPEKWYSPVRKLCIGIMTDRSMCISDRISMLGNVICRLSELSEDQLGDAAESFIAGNKPIQLPSNGEVKQKESFLIVLPADDASVLEIRRRLASVFMKTSDSICDNAEKALKNFGMDADSRADDASLVRYRKAEKAYRDICPDLDDRLERILVNHMFYTGFPFAEGVKGMKEEYLALCAAWLLTEFLIYGCVGDPRSKEEVSDIISPAYRLIENSNFNIRAAVMMHEVLKNGSNT